MSDRLTEGAFIDGYTPELEGRMLRNKWFKYWIYNQGEQRETLYDLRNDPGETVNIVGDPKFKGELEKCRHELTEWAEKYNDPYLNNMVK